MGFGDRDRGQGPGSYGPQLSGARRDSISRDVSLEATLASFETTLEQHTKLIESMVGKVDDMDKTLAGVRVQMEHLVTKESCAEGRRELAEDLKARMDGDREITGVGITVPKLWQQYVEATHGSESTASKSKKTSTSAPLPPKTTLYYVKAVSSVVSLVFAIVTITFFAYKMVDRLDRQQVVMQQQQAVMQDIQRNLRQLETTEEAVTRRIHQDDGLLPASTNPDGRFNR